MNRESNIIQTIKTKYDGFSNTYKGIADFILHNAEVATFASLDELSKKIGISDATLIRFARELGFDGYQDLRQALVRYIRGVIYPTQQSVFPAHQKETPTLDDVRNEDIEFITKTMDGINRAWFQEFIQMIMSTKRVFTMGWGVSSFLAEILALQLQRLSIEASPLIRERRPLIERMLFIKKRDLLIVFDLIEYSTEVLEAVEYLHTHKESVNLVTITNDSTAPIVQYADRTFFCETLSPLVSLTAPLCFINAIVQSIITEKPKKARTAVKKFQKDVLANPKHYYQLFREKS